MGKIELIALLNLSSWCLVMVERLFLTVPRSSLQFVIVVFPDHTHYFCNGSNNGMEDGEDTHSSPIALGLGISAGCPHPPQISEFCLGLGGGTKVFYPL